MTHERLLKSLTSHMSNAISHSFVTCVLIQMMSFKITIELAIDHY
jgi:hypothetical protein